MRPTDHLIADHARLHALLQRALASGFDPEPFAEFRAGLLRHIGIEEKVLLAAARRARGGEPIARAGALKIDHAALTSLLVPTPDRALALEIESLLRAHDAEEEGPRGVYAECERLWSEDEARELARRVAAFPSVPVARHFDGHGTVRTAAEALESARRIRVRAATARTEDAQ
ncbi:MAG: hemerythrin domain-containing protein [Sandaracinaceae bacterium]|nr:hemerythrin domain-containing protein [Sandaracinaceae bacterium]